MYQDTIKLDDKVFRVSFYGRSPVDLAHVQVGMSFRTMTKWELFKHLLWRIWTRN